MSQPLSELFIQIESKVLECKRVSVTVTSVRRQAGRAARLVLDDHRVTGGEGVALPGNELPGEASASPRFN